MKKYLILMLIVIAILSIGCSKTNAIIDPIDVVENPTKIEVKKTKWQYDYAANNMAIYTNPLMYQGNPVFAMRNENAIGDSVICLDVFSGRKLWSLSVENETVLEQAIHQNILVLYLKNANDDRRIIAYDINNLSRIWESNLRAEYRLNTAFNIVNGKVYVGFSHNKTSGLCEFDVFTGKGRDVARVEAMNGKEPAVYSPSVWFDENGRAILMVAIRYGIEIHTIRAIDQETGKTVWVGESDLKYNSIGLPTAFYKEVKVYDDKVYMVTDWNVHCFEAKSGKKLWKAEMPNNTNQLDFADTKLMVVDGKVIVNSTDKEMYAFDAESGRLIWSVNDYTRQCNEEMTLYDGVIYTISYPTGELIKVDFNDGKIISRQKSPNDIHLTKMNVLINAEHNLMIISDYKTIFCLPINY